MGILRPRFWTETTGRALRQHSAETRELAVYLSSCDECDDEPYGLYQLDIDKAVMLTGRPIQQVKGCLSILEQLGFCFFHEETTWLFVREHAAMQFKLPLTKSDMKCRAARLWYRRVDTNPFIGAWWDRYADDFNLALEPHAVQRRDFNVPDQEENTGLIPVEEFVLEAPNIKAPPFSKAASYERIAAAYPGPVSGPRAKAAYYRLNVGPVLEAEILNGIDNWKRSRQWQSDGGQWIPSFHNFLRDQRWKDRAVQAPAQRLSDRTVSELKSGEQFIHNMMKKGPGSHGR